MRRRKKIIRLLPLDHRRLKTTYFLGIISIMLLFARIVNLQVFRASDLADLARSAQIKRTNSINTRRPIVDRNNRLIAYDKTLYKLWVHPKYFNFPGDKSSQIRTIQEVTKKLSPILGKPESLILEKLNNNKSGLQLFDDITEEQALQIKSLHVSGLDLYKYSKRYYPQSNLFSNLIGFVNDDNQASAGLELHLDNRIKIFNAAKIIKKGADGTPLPDNSGPRDFIIDDKKIELTIDSRLQKISFDALLKQVEKYRAKKGFAMIMNVNNGEILSLASIPSYDPNNFWNYNQGTFRGWYSQDLFEPGSTFKPINLALALENKIINKVGYIHDEGKINVGGWTLSNWDKRGNGYIDYAKVLQVSSNVGMVKIMQNFDPSNYWDWLDKLGINKNINTDLFESTPGVLKSKEVFINQPIEKAVASFGKGFSISPLKLAQLHAVLSNGGLEVIPHVTKDFQNEIKKSNTKRYFSEDVSKTIQQWMESVVDKGSGIGARINGYRIGGKTGTSQKAINGIYTEKKVCSFIATLPTNNPKYLVLVVIDEPSKPYSYGSTVAVPVAKEIIESLIVIEKIPPQYVENKMIVKKP